MANEFAITIRCSNCASETIIASKNDPKAPRLFDNAEQALEYIESVKRRTSKTLEALDRGLGINTNEDHDALYECQRCAAVARLRDLELTAMVYRAP